VRVVIVTNKPYESCETFIKAQIDLLPVKVKHYWGNPYPYKPRNHNTFFKKTIRKLTNKKINPPEYLQYLFKKDRIQVVLAQYGMMGVEVLPVCKKLNLPLVVHFHGHDAVRHSIIEKFGKAYKALFDYEFVKIVAVSHVMEQKLIALGCPKEKIHYNPYGPNDSFFEVNPNYDKMQFVGIGRFVEKKAPDKTIEAFSKVLHRFPKARLVMAGDGELLQTCKALVEKLGISNSVEFPGRITPSQFRDYLGESLAFVQHSVTASDGDMEGTPVAILEASAAGLPVISTYHAGIPDVIKHNETGLLCEEGDVIGMRDNMIKILSNNDFANELGVKGKNRIKQEFRMSKYVSGLNNILLKSE
jgi:colanic acid/amylovoran biosynthesis glycosyltransferase